MNEKKVMTLSVKNGKLVRSSISIEVEKSSDILDEEANERIEKLNKIYKTIPETECKMCGDCCYFYALRNIYTIECLNILQYIKRTFSERQIKKIRAESKINLMLKATGKGVQDNGNKDPKGQRCPFFNKKTKRCDIQKVKPFICRTYGLYQQTKKRCANVKIIDEKERERFSHISREKLLKQIEGISENFIAFSENNEDKMVVTKTQSFDQWLAFEI